MYKKIKNLHDILLRVKTLIILFVINLIFFVGLINAKEGGWKFFYDYPKETYRSLEEEAYCIIESHDFHSGYQLRITSYDNSSNYLEFSLSDTNSSTTVTAKIKNYDKQNQKIVLERMYNSSVGQFIGISLASFILLFVISVIEMAWLIAVSLLLWGLAFVIRSIKHRIQN